MWRPEGPSSRVLLMRGWTSAYAVEPNGEYFVGAIGGRRMVARRGGTRHVVRPGELVAWDPSAAHRGGPGDGGPWLGHLLVIELAALREVLRDGDPLPADLEFRSPVIADRALAADFVRLHGALARPASALEHDSRLTAWLQRLAARSQATQAAPPPPRPRAAARDPALRRACEYLDDNLAANTTLDELAGVAGVGKFRLIRLFRAGLGVPPHRYQLAQRLRRARRLLEHGETPAAAAAATGFVDQSHLHRHFRRGLGVTPSQYVARLRAGG
jgi:AraC-like DNA-binding protein